jgi:hypothetical protein
VLFTSCKYDYGEEFGDELTFIYLKDKGGIPEYATSRKLRLWTSMMLRLPFLQLNVSLKIA